MSYQKAIWGKPKWESAKRLQAWEFKLLNRLLNTWHLILFVLFLYSRDWIFIIMLIIINLLIIIMLIIINLSLHKDSFPRRQATPKSQELSLVNLLLSSFTSQAHVTPRRHCSILSKEQSIITHTKWNLSNQSLQELHLIPHLEFKGKLPRIPHSQPPHTLSFRPLLIYATRLKYLSLDSLAPPQCLHPNPASRPLSLWEIASLHSSLRIPFRDRSSPRRL